MPRVIVTTDTNTDTHAARAGGAPVLLSESVRSLHLSSEHAAAQLIERLVWAVADAEAIEEADGWDFSLTRRRGGATRAELDGRREADATPEKIAVKQAA